jgi:hypothetical protein
MFFGCPSRQAFFGVIVLGIFLAQCKRDEKFEELGDNFAGPVDAASSDSGDYFYILNTDFDRTYNTGAISVLDESGNKVNQVEVQRMGRSLTVGGTDMIITYDRTDDDIGPRAQLWDTTDEQNPVMKREWDLDCSPFNAVLRKGYPHFIITCTSGSIFLGTLADDRQHTGIKKIRNYGVARRAIHIDTERELVFGFATDLPPLGLYDALYEDAKTYNNKAVEEKVSTINDEGEEVFSSVPNEIPDIYEETLKAQSLTNQRLAYQFFVYDIAAERDGTNPCVVSEEEDCVFPKRSLTDPVVKNELRWLYFHARNFDGSPDIFNLSSTKRYYRTNFWDAEPDPDDASAFYLSHRGPPLEDINKGSPYANHVVRVKIEGDVRAGEDGAPKTEDVMTFERVYGFKGENRDYHYPGDIQVGYVDGQKILVTNHFRDLDNWVRDDVYFSIAVKILDENIWWEETPNNFDPLESYFQFAMNSKGTIISPSYYGNQVMALDVKPGVGISVRRIK